VPDDAGQVPPETSAAAGPPAPPAPPAPSAPAESDATMVGIHEPYGTWLAAADRAAGTSNQGPSSQGEPRQGAPNQGAAGAESRPPQAGWGQAGGAAANGMAPPPAPPADGARRKKIRRRIIVWVIVVVLIGALIAAAFITRSILAKGKYGPQHQVEDYLQAIVDGKASTATKLLDPNVTTDERVLVTDDVYAATEGRPTDFDITSTEINGSTATVKADLVQDGKTDPVTFTLVKDGKRDVVFDDWSLDSGPQQSVDIGSVPSKVKVNGVDVELGKAVSAAQQDDAAESVSLPVLPGNYHFTAPKGSQYVTYGKDVDVSKRLDGEDGGQTPVTFTTSYTAKVYTEASAQIEKKISTCTKDKDMFVQACLAASWESTSYDATFNIHRDWDSGPTVTLQDDDQETATTGDDATKLHGNLVATIDAGLLVEAKGRYDADDKDGYDTGDNFNPFTDRSGDPLQFPLKIDGNKLTVGGLSQIDRYDPDYISSENRAKYSQYKTKE
jgi:hypothetical protein